MITKPRFVTVQPRQDVGVRVAYLDSTSCQHVGTVCDECYDQWSTDYIIRTVNS